MEERVFTESKFNFGNVIVTTPLFEYCKARGFALFPYMVRHASCDWGTFAKKIGKATTKPLKMGKGCYPNISSLTEKESGLSPSGTEALLLYFFRKITKSSKVPCRDFPKCQNGTLDVKSLEKGTKIFT